MKIMGMARRAAALLAAAGIIFSAQGFSSYAGVTGVGAAQPEQGGPGVSSGTAEETISEIGPGTADPQETKAADAQEAGQAEAGDQAAQPAEAGPLLAANYSGFIVQRGWSGITQDNGLCGGGPGTWLTAFKANLVNIPAGQIGICYQVNLSGSGWLEWAYDGAETGGAGGVQPLEAIRMELTGELASGYDLYYKVFQNGAWTPWAVNGGTAGTEGVGLWMEAVRVSITARGAG